MFLHSQSLLWVSMHFFECALHHFGCYLLSFWRIFLTLLESWKVTLFSELEFHSKWQMSRKNRRCNGIESHLLMDLGVPKHCLKRKKKKKRNMILMAPVWNSKILDTNLERNTKHCIISCNLELYTYIFQYFINARVRNKLLKS